MPQDDGAEQAKRIREELEKTSTSIERGMREAARKSKEELKKLAESGVEAAREISSSMELLESETAHISEEMARNFADNMGEAAKTMDAKFLPYVNDVLRRSVAKFRQHGVDISRALGATYFQQQARGQDYQYTEAQRFAKLKYIGDSLKYSNPDHFAAQAFSSHKEGVLVDLEQRKAQVQAAVSSGVLSEREGARAVGKLQSEQNRHARQMMFEQLSDQKTVEEGKRKAIKTTFTDVVANDHGIVGNLLRKNASKSNGIGKFLAVERVEKETGTRVGGSAVGGALSRDIMGQMVSGLASLANAVAPLGVELAIVTGAVKLLFEMFERTKQVGSHAYVAAANGAQKYENALDGVLNTGVDVQASTMDQRKAAAWYGVAIDDITEKSLDQIAVLGMGKGVDRGTMVGRYAHAFNAMQSISAMNGMTPEAGMGKATEFIRAFGGKDPDNVVRFFKNVRAAGAQAGMSLSEFAEGLGDLTSIGQQFGYKGLDSYIARMGSLASGADSAATAQMMMGAGTALMNQSLPRMIGMSMAANGGGFGRNAASLQAAARGDEATGGAGGVFQKVLEDFRHAAVKYGVVPGDDAASQAKAAMFASHFFGDKVGKAMFMKPDLLKSIMRSQNVATPALQEQIQEAVKNSDEETRGLSIMGMQQNTLTQILNIMRELAVAFAGSGFMKMLGVDTTHLYSSSLTPGSARKEAEKAAALANAKRGNQ